VKNDSNTSHGIDQKEINGILKVMGCDEKTPNNDANRTRMKHSECRFEEIEKLADKTVKCTKYEGNRTAYPDPPACSLKEVRTTDPQEKNKFEACMDEFGKWFGLHALYKPCKEATEAHQNQKAQCHQLQSKFEDSSCDCREDGKSYCKCRATHIGLYDSFCKGIRQKEAARKADYEAAERIDCLFKVWETGTSSDNETGTSKNTTLSKCKMMTVDTQHLTIDYGSIPVADLTCGPTNQVCDSNWLKEEYTSQAWYPKAPTGTCTPCPTPAPTPAPTPTPVPTSKPDPSKLRLWFSSWDHLIYCHFNGSNPQVFSPKAETKKVHGIETSGVSAFVPGLDAVYVALSIHYGSSPILRKLHDGSPIQLLPIPYKHGGDPAYQVQKMLISQSKIYWSVSGSGKALHLVYRANLDGSAVEAVVHKSEFEKLGHKSHEATVQFTIVEGEGAMYLTKDDHNHKAFLYRKTLDGSEMTVVKQLFSGTTWLWKYFLLESGVFVLTVIVNPGSNPNSWPFHLCSLTGKDSMPCTRRFTASYKPHPNNVIMDTIHDKVVWNNGPHVYFDNDRQFDMKKASKGCCNLPAFGIGL